MILENNTTPSSNGRTKDFGSFNRSSNLRGVNTWFTPEEFLKWRSLYERFPELHFPIQWQNSPRLVCQDFEYRDPKFTATPRSHAWCQIIWDDEDHGYRWFNIGSCRGYNITEE